METLRHSSYLYPSHSFVYVFNRLVGVIMTYQEIRKLRAALGWTKIKFAEKFIISVETVSSWEGKNKTEEERRTKHHVFVPKIHRLRLMAMYRFTFGEEATPWPNPFTKKVEEENKNEEELHN